MSVKFRSPLELSAHRAIAHSDAAQTLEVTVAAKTAAHPEFGNGSANGYIIDGVEGAYLEFTPGNTYKFDQSDSSNTGHPLRFYEDAAKTTAYTTGVTTAGTPGSAGAYTQIIPTTSTNPILYYQCSAHSLMGSYAKFGTGSQGDTYTLSASQDGDNVDILLDAGSGTDSTVQLTAGNNITLTRSSAQEIEIASSGGGGGTVTVQKNVYTANGSTTTFNTSTAIVNENNVQVYIDGVYQSKDNYTTSGSTVTMSTAPPNTTSVELIHMVAVDGVIARDSFTGNGSTTAYVLSMSISNENATQVYIDGVYQSKDNYTTSGSTLTFSTAPPNGAAVEVVHIKAVAASTLNQNNFTGDGSTTAFTLSQTVTDETNTFVFIQGVYQEKGVYSISGTTLTFTTAPQNGYTVEVMAFGTITVGNQTAAGTDWQSTIQTSNFTAVAGEGYFVNTTSAAITVTLPSSPISGDEVNLVDYAGTADTNNITITSSDNINGASDDVLIDYERGGVSIVYVDATQGWIAYNAANETAEALMPATLDVDYLVVAGGGGGGSFIGTSSVGSGGGGGAGGYLTSYNDVSVSASELSLSTNYTITVGAGGNGGQYNQNAVAGSDSVFNNITAAGGGLGGSYGGANGGSGGSGGGAGYSNTAGSGNTPSTTPSQGNAGGTMVTNVANYGCGGGGGAGGAGGNFTSGTVAGAGGAGLSNSITGTSLFYSGGGGGALGGSGSGGAGGSSVGGDGGHSASHSGGNGTDNRGGGGGGHSGASQNTSGSAGNGGSGVVILRYPQQYFIHYPGTLASSTTTVGTDKVTTFTSGTGNITFETSEDPSRLNVDYLVVAGGGGGGGVTSPARGGGGGAGGLRTSYGSTSGGGASAESSLNLAAATNYTVTVGTGGTAGTQGNNSVFSTITSTGGGFGGAYNISPAKVGGTGGSGGGSGADGGNNSSLRGLAVTSPVVQGYDGGYGTVPSGCDGGGGGGAGAVGGNGALRTSTGGVGGAGLAVNILNSTNAGTASVGEVSGSDVYYAGGAGGGSDSNPGRRAGGIGGGGAGGDGPSGVNYGDAGTANTGGGGGAGGEGGTSANGGSGVVILRYPSGYSITVGSGITEASSSPFTEGSNKVSVFTAGTGNISFS